MSTWSLSPNIIIIITPILRRYSCLSSLSSPSDYSDISLSQSSSYSEVTTTPSPYHTPSSSLAYFMSTVFGNRWRISPQTLYSTFGPSTYVSGYGHARNDLVLLSHVYSMSHILPVVYSLYTSLYFPSFESWLSSSNLFSELSLSFVLALYLVLQNLGQRRRWAVQHIRYGQSPILTQVLFLGNILQVYIHLVRISTLDKLRL